MTFPRNSAVFFVVMFTSMPEMCAHRCHRDR